MTYSFSGAAHSTRIFLSGVDYSVWDLRVFCTSKRIQIAERLLALGNITLNKKNTQNNNNNNNNNNKNKQTTKKKNKTKQKTEWNGFDSYGVVFNTFSNPPKCYSVWSITMFNICSCCYIHNCTRHTRFFQWILSTLPFI